MKTIEEVISLTVLTGTSTNNVTKQLSSGKISRVAMFFPEYSGKNTGFVRASIKDNTGTEISQMQSIENYRDREAGYLDGKKPLPAEGGSQFTVTVQATENFTSDFLVDCVFVYVIED